MGSIEGSPSTSRYIIVMMYERFQAGGRGAQCCREMLAPRAVVGPITVD